MLGDDNLHNHEVYDSFFASEEQTKEVKKLKVPILVFLGFFLLIIPFTFLDFFITRGLFGIFDFAVIAAMGWFLFGLTGYDEPGYLASIISVVVGVLSLALWFASIFTVFSQETPTEIVQVIKSLPLDLASALSAVCTLPGLIICYSFIMSRISKQTLTLPKGVIILSTIGFLLGIIGIVVGTIFIRFITHLR